MPDHTATLIDLARRFAAGRAPEHPGLDLGSVEVRDALAAAERSLALRLRGRAPAFYAWLRDRAGQSGGRRNRHLAYLVLHGSTEEVGGFLRSPDEVFCLGQLMLRHRVGPRGGDLHFANYVLGAGDVPSLSPHRVAQIRGRLEESDQSRRPIVLPPYRDEITTQILPMLVVPPLRQSRNRSRHHSWIAHGLSLSEHETLTLALWEFAEEIGIALHIVDGWSDLAIETALHQIYAAVGLDALNDARINQTPAIFQVHQEPGENLEVEVCLPNGHFTYLTIPRILIAHNPEAFIGRLNAIGTCATVMIGAACRG